ncbi:MAG: nitrite reductase (NAD(P)H) small subunit [Candidatus Aenigmarchaeota archaeon]|nr:nitrite reductase (NAD(P)H) small subunit [Candidatus Aenigmarchaeota archaeon]
MALITACKTSDVEEGFGRVVKAGGKEIALFKNNGEFFAIDNTCPHQGGPLGEGQLYDDGSGVGVICPLHGYMFNIKTGEGMSFPTGVNSYRVVVEGDEVKVEV